MDFITIAIPRTPTLVPTPTINPCSACGWADIATYVTQFGLIWGSTPVGISTSTFLLQLKNIESKINTVSIDACTEHAGQLVMGGLDNIIYGLQLIFDNPNDSQVHDVMVKGVTMMDDANVELADLGIDITLSLKCSFQIRCSPISGLVDNHPLQLNHGVLKVVLNFEI